MPVAPREKKEEISRAQPKCRRRRASPASGHDHTSTQGSHVRDDSDFERDRARHGTQGRVGTNPADEQADGASDGPATAGDEHNLPVDQGPAEDTATESAGAAVGAASATADAQRELEAQRDRYLRLAAEFDNYRRRTNRERQEVAARAQGELVKQLLDTLDDLGRALAVNPTTDEAKAVVDGVEIVERKLLKVLASNGLEVINPVDHAFNPELHEAVATEPALSREDDHLVSRVFQPGYLFQGQLLRPARVVVKQWNG